MKRHTTTATLLASAIMLALVGCDGTSMSATEGSSEMEMTEENLREIAKAEMVAGEDASSAASSEDAATAASSESSDAATTASSAEKVASKTDIAATTASSADKTTSKADAASTATSATPAPAENKDTASSNTAAKSDGKDYQFTYNGTVVSIKDDFDTVNNALGGYVPGASNIQNLQSYYSYGKNDAVGMICRNDFGSETPITISTRVAGMTTSRNISVGSSKDELIAAYGSPNGKHSQVYDGATGKELTEEEYVAYFGDSFVYDMGDIQISFSVSNGKVASIEIKNNANYKKFQWS
jgi:hypothetical protein